MRFAPAPWHSAARYQPAPSAAASCGSVPRSSARLTTDDRLVGERGAELRGTAHDRAGKMPVRAMQVFSARYGCIVLCGWSEPTLAIALASMFAVPLAR